VRVNDDMGAAVRRCRTWDAKHAARRIAELRQEPGALLPILQALNEEFGYIDKAAVPLIAEALNLSRAEVHGVASFYRDFRTAPPGLHVLKLCRAEACQSMGAEMLAAEARQRLRIDWGETSADGRVTLEPVFCLGLCACAPAAMLDGKVVGGLDPVRLGALLDQARQP
jgi:formate dehydrogenase subunit gamma